MWFWQELQFWLSEITDHRLLDVGLHISDNINEKFYAGKDLTPTITPPWCTTTGSLGIISDCIYSKMFGLIQGTLVMVFLRNYYDWVLTIYIAHLGDRVQGASAVIIENYAHGVNALFHQRVAHSNRFVIPILWISVITTTDHKPINFTGVI